MRRCYIHFLINYPSDYYYLDDPMEQKIKFKIENVFAKFSLGISLDIEALLKDFPNAIYDPWLSPSVDITDKKNGITFRIFSTGQVICLGGKSAEQVKSCIRNFLKNLRKKGYGTSSDVDVEISNYVASGSVGKRLRLWKAAYFLEGAEYDPKQFPGLIYKMRKPKVSFTIFENGNTILTGAKNKKEIEKALRKLLLEIENSDLFYKQP